MIRMEQVSKIFPARNGHPVTALREVSFDVHPGEFVTVVGPSGSGKSTLLFTIGGMQHPTEGSVYFAGTDLYRLSASKRAALRRTRIGFVFQTFNLIPYLNCVDNVVVPAVLAGRSRSASMPRARELLERVDLDDRLQHKPAELSVGERQRVALCRSLINEPDVILADEPTGNLDGAMAEEVMDILLILNSEGQTIVMATHNVRLTEQASRLVILRDGTVEEDMACRAAEAMV